MVLKLNSSVNYVLSVKMTASRSSSPKQVRPKGWSISFLPWNSVIPISHGMTKRLGKPSSNLTRANFYMNGHNLLAHKLQKKDIAYRMIVRTAIFTVKPDNIATFLEQCITYNCKTEVGTNYKQRILGTRIKHHMGDVSISREKISASTWEISGHLPCPESSSGSVSMGSLNGWKELTNIRGLMFYIFLRMYPFLHYKCILPIFLLSMAYIFYPTTYEPIHIRSVISCWFLHIRST